MTMRSNLLLYALFLAVTAFSPGCKESDPLVAKVDEWPWPDPPDNFRCFAVHVQAPSILDPDTMVTTSAACVRFASEPLVDADVTLNGRPLNFSASTVAYGSTSLFFNGGDAVVLEVHSDEAHMRRESVMPAVPVIVSPANDSGHYDDETIEIAWTAEGARLCIVRIAFIGSSREDLVLTLEKGQEYRQYVGGLYIQDPNVTAIGCTVTAYNGDGIFPGQDVDPCAGLGLNGLWLATASRVKANIKHR